MTNAIALLTPETTTGTRALVSEQAAINHFSTTIAILSNDNTTTIDDIFDDLDLGTLTFSGNDATLLGSSYSPLAGGLITSTSVFNPVGWTDFIPKGAVSIGFLTVASDSILLYFSPSSEAGSGYVLNYYSYSIPSCAQNSECSNVIVDMNSLTVTFNNVTLPATIYDEETVLTNLASGPLTINGTLAMQIYEF